MFETAQPQADTANQPEDTGSPKTEGFWGGKDTPEAPDSDTYEDGCETGQSGSNETERSEGNQGETFLTIRYNKEDMPLSKEEAVVFAQKGMNYDKLSERIKELSARLGEYEKGSKEAAPDNEAEKQIIIDSQLNEFIRENPEVDPRTLPEKVIGEWKRGMPLAQAFLKHQAQELSAKLKDIQETAAKTELNRKNEAASMGKASEGASRDRAINEESIKSMTPEELDRNHERIWAFLTGKQ